VNLNSAKTTATITFNETENCVVKLAGVSGRVFQTKTIVAAKSGKRTYDEIKFHPKLLC